MLHRGVGIGSISVSRQDKGPFRDHHIALLETFADQAVIAIENVWLFKELQSRTDALTTISAPAAGVERGERAVSSTLDLETVLQTIVRSAVRLTGLDGGASYEYASARGVRRWTRAASRAGRRLGRIRRATARREPWSPASASTRLRVDLAEAGIGPGADVPGVLRDRRRSGHGRGRQVQGALHRRPDRLGRSQPRLAARRALAGRAPRMRAWSEVAHRRSHWLLLGVLGVWLILLSLQIEPRGKASPDAGRPARRPDQAGRPARRAADRAARDPSPASSTRAWTRSPTG